MKSLKRTIGFIIVTWKLYRLNNLIFTRNTRRFRVRCCPRTSSSFLDLIFNIFYFVGKFPWCISMFAYWRTIIGFLHFGPKNIHCQLKNKLDKYNFIKNFLFIIFTLVSHGNNSHNLVAAILYSEAVGLFKKNQIRKQNLTLLFSFCNKI